MKLQLPLAARYIRPRPHVSWYFRIRNLFFPDMATIHTHPANSTANPEKNKSATNPITCGRVNPDIFDSDDVKSVSSLSPNHKPIWRHKVESTCRAKRANFPPLSRSTAHALKTIFSAEEPWVLEWIRIPSDACGRANSIWIRYVWTGKVLNLERKSCLY